MKYDCTFSGSEPGYFARHVYWFSKGEMFPGSVIPAQKRGYWMTVDNGHFNWVYLGPHRKHIKEFFFNF